MKAIELTEEHKAKLLEMCNKLFPECTIWWKYEMYGRALKQNFNEVLAVAETLNPPINVGTKEKPWRQTTNYFNIHWFEFCMTHLPLKIYYEKNKKGGMNLEIITNNLLRFEDFGRYEINPIDYLYKEFKKLKQ